MAKKLRVVANRGGGEPLRGMFDGLRRCYQKEGFTGPCHGPCSTVPYLVPLRSKSRRVGPSIPRCTPRASECLPQTASQPAPQPARPAEARASNRR